MKTNNAVQVYILQLKLQLNNTTYRGSQFSDVAHFDSAKCDFYALIGETPQSLVKTKTDPELNRLYLTPIADDIIHRN